MNTNYQISISLDKRRKNKSGKYPVRLQVFTSTPRVQKRYATKFECTESEFESVWITTKPRKVHQPLRKKFQAVEARANHVAEGLNPFTFEEFEKKLFRKTGEGSNVK